jgi:sulfur carrier protein
MNGNSVELADGITVAGLLDDLGRDGRGIAVAVNEEVVPRSTWAHVMVCVGDRVEVLTVAQGG